METIKTVDLTPVGYQTPEGIARVNRAVRRLDDERARAANEAASLLRDHDHTLRHALENMAAGKRAYGYEEEAKDALEALEAVTKAIESMHEWQEEFLRALAGRGPIATAKADAVAR
jgi:ABC-type transporter Mla subunit MlaD